MVSDESSVRENTDQPPLAGEAFNVSRETQFLDLVIVSEYSTLWGPPIIAVGGH